MHQNVLPKAKPNKKKEKNHNVDSLLHKNFYAYFASNPKCVHVEVVFSFSNAYVWHIVKVLLLIFVERDYHLWQWWHESHSDDQRDLSRGGNLSKRKDTENSSAQIDWSW